MDKTRRPQRRDDQQALLQVRVSTEFKRRVDRYWTSRGFPSFRDFAYIAIERMMDPTAPRASLLDPVEREALIDRLDDGLIHLRIATLHLERVSPGSADAQDAARELRRIAAFFRRLEAAW